MRIAFITSAKRKSPARTCGAYGFALILIGAASGCTARNGVLTIEPTATTKLISSPKQIPPKYAAHVNDKIKLTYRTRWLGCDYAICQNVATGKYEDCGPLIADEFTWPEIFDKPTDEGGAIRLTVRGYQLNGFRDVMPVRGELVKAETVDDPADMLVAETSVDILVYQSRLEFTVKLPEGQPDWQHSRLTLVGESEKKTRVRFANKKLKGFHVDEPNDAWEYHVYYEPGIDEINRRVVTQAVLDVADKDAKIHRYTTTLIPPH